MAVSAPAVFYPESDGKPMAENTLQFQWIVTIQGNLDLLFRDRPDVLVAGDNLWYPVEGDTTLCTAPDVYVAFGRPKGHRGSYRQWEEGGLPPAVAFEVLSPSNSAKEMNRKRQFYEQYGVDEYYVIDPDPPAGFEVWTRDAQSGRLTRQVVESDWTSPRLGVRFASLSGEVRLFGPDGRRFLSFVELGELAEQQRREAAAERRKARAERKRADTEQQRADRLAAKLRELGIDPDAL